MLRIIGTSVVASCFSMIKTLSMFTATPNKLLAIVYLLVVSLGLQGCMGVSVRLFDKQILDISAEDASQRNDKGQDGDPEPPTQSTATSSPQVKQPTATPSVTKRPVVEKYVAPSALETVPVQSQSVLPQTLTPPATRPPVDPPEKLSDMIVANAPLSDLPAVATKSCAARWDDLLGAYNEASNRAMHPDPLIPYAHLSRTADGLWRDCHDDLNRPELVHGVLGFIYFLNGQFDQAVAAFDDSLRRYGNRNKSQTATEIAKLNTIIKSCQNRPNILDMHRSADALYSQRRYEEATQGYQRIKQQASTCPAVRMHASNQLHLIETQHLIQN